MFKGSYLFLSAHHFGALQPLVNSGVYIPSNYCFKPPQSSSSLQKKLMALWTTIVHVDVSEDRWIFPQIIHFNRVFHYKPSILGPSPIFGNTHVYQGKRAMYKERQHAKPTFFPRNPCLPRTWWLMGEAGDVNVKPLFHVDT